MCLEVIEKAIQWNKVVTATHQPLQHFEPLNRVLSSVGFYKIRVLICREWFNMRGRETRFTKCSAQFKPGEGVLGLKKKKKQPPTVGEQRLWELPEERLEQAADDVEVPPFLEGHHEEE